MSVASTDRSDIDLSAPDDSEISEQHKYDSVLTTVSSSSTLFKLSKPLVLVDANATYTVNKVMRFETAMEVKDKVEMSLKKVKSVDESVSQKGSVRGSSVKSADSRFHSDRNARLDGNPNVLPDYVLFDNIVAINKLRNMRTYYKKYDKSKLQQNNQEIIKYRFWRNLWAARFSILTFIIPFIYLPIIFIWNTKESRACYCLFILSTYWISNVISISISSFLPIGLFAILGLMESNYSCLLYFNDDNFALFASTIFAIAFTQWRVNKRCAYFILYLSGATLPRMLALFILVCAIISFFVDTALTIGVMLSIAQAVLDSYNTARKARLAQDGASEREIKQSDTIFKKYCCALKLSVPFAINTSTIASVDVSDQSMYFRRILKHYDNLSKVSQDSWFLITVPYVICCLVELWVLLMIYFLGIEETVKKMSKRQQLQMRGLVKIEYIKLGRIRFVELILIVSFLSISILIFIHRSDFINYNFGFNLSPGVISIFGVALLFILPNRLPTINELYALSDIDFHPRGINISPIVKWSDIAQTFPWDVIFLNGCSVCIGQMLIRSGLINMFADTISTWCDNMIKIIFIIIFTSICLTSILFNTTSARIAFTIGQIMSFKLEVNPYLFVSIIYTCCNNSHMFIFSCLGNVLAYASGNISRMQMFKAGAIYTLLCVCTQLVMFSYLYVYYNMNEYPQGTTRYNSTFLYEWPTTNFQD